MRKPGLLLLLNFLCICLIAQKAELSKSDMVKLDFKLLAESKSKIKAKDPSVLPAYEQLLKDAERSLNYKPVSVMDKKDLPPSKDKHDYMSIAPYWWPDPAKPNGLPYIRRDGEVNPEVLNYSDKESMPRLCEHVYNLALAYYFTENEDYARHAVKLIDTWFLDPATSMNPNLNFGQAIKGITDGRAEGLIEVRHFIFLLDGVSLLKKSKHFKQDELLKLKTWMSRFLDWLQHSPIGKDELEAKNNHGVWYDATALAIAIFVENKPLANAIVKRAADRLEEQMDEKGFFPLELARTTSLHYSTFVLDAFVNIAQLSEMTDFNLWTYQTKSQHSLEKAFEAIIPYWADPSKWTYPQIKHFSVNNSYQCLWRASEKFNCKLCKTVVKKSSSNFPILLINLL